MKRRRGGLALILGGLLLAVLTGCSMDVEPLDLRSLKRSWAPNDALACPGAFCSADSDFKVPVYPLAPEALRALVHRVATGEERIELVAESGSLDQLVYVQRSEVLGFPDIIRVQLVTDPLGSSAIFYSRSRYGFWDIGVNRKRLRRWLDQLDEAVQATI